MSARDDYPRTHYWWKSDCERALSEIDALRVDRDRWKARAERSEADADRIDGATS